MEPDQLEPHGLSAEETVAINIVQTLIARGLLQEDDADLTYYGLLEGKLRQADWRLLAEKAIQQGVGE